MAGTDRGREPILGGPAIILVEPQLGENIGAAARAMLNFGLTDLRLVKPRDGWPNPRAKALASRADMVIDNARLFDSTAEAIADLSRVYATTARQRDMSKRVATPAEAADEMRAAYQAGATCGVLFGGERAGLHNDDIVLADTVLTVPLNPAFASINLAQAVLLIGYEWFQTGGIEPASVTGSREAPPASKADLVHLFEHLEDELTESGFFDPTPGKKPVMVRNLRNMLQRAGFTEPDVRTLRGVIKSLAQGRRRRSGVGDAASKDGEDA
ncbi:RNA methyltransferase [Oceanibacterium hippocampi]|uniref:tRNA (cytidine/uridine-2'-O-)-methyltransferase TrmJ n=1 Tax=Oceanibacterium hippocampi TaxID=745714 RepID=A0A1Y5T8V4_9PROT|nr:RNA methyltransferase [Oceanibacterium hippocampi]SLN56442.1 putative tRNA/rRNA methyltransferase [Oceanibacterium hippocampi]